MSTCPLCKTVFTCGVADANSDAPCWCMDLPAIELQHGALSNAGLADPRCICRNCLEHFLPQKPEVTNKPDD